MTVKLREAARMVRSTAAYVEADVEECMGDDGMVAIIPLDAYNDMMEAITALREALDHSGEPTEKVEQDCGGGHHHRYAGRFGE